MYYFTKIEDIYSAINITQKNKCLVAFVKNQVILKQLVH
jgi:hypothetical protein